MGDDISDDTIAIVASNLAAAQIAAGHHYVTADDPEHGVLTLYWTYLGELHEARDRERKAR